MRALSLFRQGIEVQSTGGGELRSSIAARKAVYQTVISRFLLQVRPPPRDTINSMLLSKPVLNHARPAA